MCATMIQKRNNTIPSWNPSTKKRCLVLQSNISCGQNNGESFQFHYLKTYRQPSFARRDRTAYTIPPLTPYASPFMPDVSRPFGFAARGGDLVRLVCLVYRVFLVYLVRRTRVTRQTRAPES